MTQLPRIMILNDRSVARGGATGMSLLTARMLKERGRDVVFVTGDDGDSPVLKDLGIPCVALGERALQAAKGPAAKLLSLGKGIWNRAGAAFLSDWIAREGRPDDIWHLQTWAQIWSPSVFAALAPVRHRLFVHAHDYFNACPNGAFWNYPAQEICTLVPLSGACLRSNCDKRSYGQKLWRVARQSRLGTTFQTADAPRLLLIHPGLREPFLRSGFHAGRMDVLRNPVEPFLDAPINVAGNRGLLFVGRLDHEKGARLLAQAAARAQVPVTFVGEGPEAEAIRSICPHAVLTGWQDRQGIAAHARQARALVMPSVYPEPFGLAAVEALGSGVPVIVSHTALLAPEIVAAGAGWAVDVRDETGFAACLAEVCAEQTDIAAFSDRAAQIAPQLGMTRAAWCDRLEALYASL